MDESKNSVDDITRAISELSVLSFRKLDEMNKLTKHLRYVQSHPVTQSSPVVLKYLKNLEKTNQKIFLQKREGVQVEFILTTEKKSSVQRQRFNSLPVSDVPELLKAEFSSAENALQVHICTDCDVEIEINDEEPLMESLQKHFDLEIHQPKLKRQSISVAEPVSLPNMSRRMSAMESGEIRHIEQISKGSEKIDRSFATKLETCLIRYLPDKSEASMDSAVKFYQNAYDKLCHEITLVDFSPLNSSVAPIIMSIKDNVNQNFSSDANKNLENDENDQNLDKSAKNQVKKLRYYGPIETVILKLLADHKILSLTDDRTGKPAFFCMACEYYTLRFRYDSVLNHIFSETHTHNLSCILQSDKHIPFLTETRTIEKIKELNTKFLNFHYLKGNGYNCECALCHTFIENQDAAVLHTLDENHLAKLSDKLYHKSKANPDSQSEEWGAKSLDWSKFLAGTGKALTNRDPLVVENFIKPSGKIANYCTCCEMTLKGPRQVLFNHIRQKKHLRNAAPFKLNLLFRNHCRPTEYYASFGNCYVCTICPNYVAMPSFAAVVQHFESSSHIETVAKMIKTALYSENIDEDILKQQSIEIGDEVKCTNCDVVFENVSDAILHCLSSVKHQNLLLATKLKENRGDIISAYMNGNFILHKDGSTFNCVYCKGVFNSLRSLLMHLVYAEHFVDKPGSESIFRFYLELKHNINLLARNKYNYYEFGRVLCGVCDADLDETENVKRHVVSARHRENMGASYIQLNLDSSNVE